MKKEKKPKRAEAKKGIGGRSFLGPVAAAIAMAVSYALFMKGGIVQGISGFDVSFLLLPSLAMLSAMLASQVIGSLLGGSLVPRIRGALHWLAVGLFLFFLLLLFPRPPAPPELRAIAFPVFFLFLIAAAYVLAGYITQRLPASSAIAKSAALALAGLTFWFALSSAAPSWRGVPLPIVFLSGFALSAVAFLLSALSLSKNPYLSAAGRWFKSLPAPAFFLGVFLALYFTWLRLPASVLLGGWLVLAEWGVVCLACGIGFAVLRWRVKRTTKPVSYGAWVKHLQVVKMKEDKDLVDVSGLTRDFVDRGSKGGILVYLISAANASGASRDRVLHAVEGMVNYQDAPLPSIALRWEVERLKDENKKARRRVLENTIRELGKL